MDSARRLRIEVAIVLALSLGASAVYSIVSIIARLTAERPLGQQSAALNQSRSAREWLDFTYQFLDVVFGLAVVALIWPALRALEARSPDGHRGVAEVASAGICGLGLYWFLVRALA